MNPPWAAGGRKWPTKWRRGPRPRPGRLAWPRSSTTQPRRARPREGERSTAPDSGCCRRARSRCDGSWTTWRRLSTGSCSHASVATRRPPRTCCRRRCSKRSGVRRRSGASRRFPPGCAQLQGAGWPATTRPKGAPKWHEGRCAWSTPTRPPGSGADLVERQDEVVRALGRLPALQRQVLVLKYLEDLSVEDIAGQVSRSRVQVQSLLQRGREGLRRQLGAQGA